MYFFNNAGVFSGYFFTVLGGAIANTSQLPAWVPVTLGVIGCIMFGMSSLICLRREPRICRATSFWMAIGGYGALGAMAVAVGRSANGIPHALESRYILFSNLFWIATLVLTFVTFELAWRACVSRGLRRYLVGLKTALVMFMLICAGLFGMSSAHALALWQARYGELIVVRDEMLCFAPDQALLARTFLDPVKLKRRMEFLTRHKLSAFRDKKSFREYKIIPVPAGGIAAAWSNSPPAAGLPPNMFYASGRAFDPGKRQPARGVLFVDDRDVIVARTRVKAAADFAQSSWEIAISAAKFPAGPVRLQLYAMLQDGELLAPIGAMNFDVAPPAAPQAPATIAFKDSSADVVGNTERMRVADDQVYGIGWARDPASGQPGRWIIVTDEATNILAYARVAENRDDVARQLRNSEMLKSGWRVAFRQSCLAPGQHLLKTWLFLPEERQALKLPKNFEVAIPPAAAARTNSSGD